MPRRDISMPEQEVHGFLTSCAQMVVGAIGADGWPTGALAASTYTAGRLTLTLPPQDPILGHLRHDPHLCCLADVHDSYYEIRGVIVHGRATAAPGDGTIEVGVDEVISFDFGRLR